MSELFNLKDWELKSNGELLQQIAALSWLKNGDDHKQLYETVTGVRVGYELFQRLNGQRDIDTYQAQCIAGIVDYVKRHPRASEDELAREITKQIELFKFKVEDM